MFITSNGIKKLRLEIESLKKQSGLIAKEINIAREKGDLSENEEYHSAVKAKSTIDRKTLELVDISRSSSIIEASLVKSDKVGFGATVTIQDVENEKKYKYSIVHSYEVDSDNKISYDTPRAKDMLGCRKGDYFITRVGGKEVEYEILDLVYTDIN